MRRWLVVITLLGAAGCLWRGYAAILSVHLDVLTQTANKLVAVVASGRGISTEGIAEYVYPAKRGREFLRQFASYSPRQSYQQFQTLLDRYEALVKEADTARAQERAWQEVLPSLGKQRDDILALAAETRNELRREE